MTVSGAHSPDGPTRETWMCCCWSEAWTLQNVTGRLRLPFRERNAHQGGIEAAWAPGHLDMHPGSTWAPGLGHPGIQIKFRCLTWGRRATAEPHTTNRCDLVWNALNGQSCRQNPSTRRVTLPEETLCAFSTNKFHKQSGNSLQEGVFQNT